MKDETEADLVSKGIVQEILLSFSMFSEDNSLICAAAAALLNVSFFPSHKALLIDLNAMPTLLQLLKTMKVQIEEKETTTNVISETVNLASTTEEKRNMNSSCISLRASKWLLDCIRGLCGLERGKVALIQLGGVSELLELLSICLCWGERRTDDSSFKETKNSNIVLSSIHIGEYYLFLS